MSTKERYGSAVWQGLQKAQSSHEAGERGMWHSASTIGEFAGVSAMTARKYLKILEGMGKVSVLIAGSSAFYMITFDGGDE